jgi:hypothetical protein
MESNVQCFTQMPDAKVNLDGIKTLKEYLHKVIPTYNGYPVLKFTTTGSEVFVHILNTHREKPQKHFFGYIEDVALNVQGGFYEDVTDE